MRTDMESAPYGVGLVFGFVGEDSILPLKLDAFRFGRLIAYPYKFDRNGWQTYGVVCCGLGTSLEKCCENIICQGIDKFAI